jgi:CDP-diacylglycerol---glycerol-3-phosphate 3-phosphatidyltransferase
MVTLFSLLPAAGAGVAIAFGWFGLASVLAVMATFCDILDGLLARKTGVSSSAGEVIDAAVDRYGEFFLLGGLVYYYRSHDQVLFIVLAAIIGGFMVSYSTAKAEAMGVVAPRGAMRRGERGAYLIFGSAFTPVAKAVFANSASLALHESPIILALSIVAVVSNFSVVQRLGAVIEALRAKDKMSATAAPEDPVDPIGSKPDASAGQV